jgi:hypothetical protein
VLEGEAVKPQRDGDAADEGGVVLALPGPCWTPLMIESIGRKYSQRTQIDVYLLSENGSSDARISNRN